MALDDILKKAELAGEKKRINLMEQVSKAAEKAKYEYLKKELTNIKRELENRFKDVTQKVLYTYDTKNIGNYVAGLEKVFEQFSEGTRKPKKIEYAKTSDGGIRDKIRLYLSKEYKSGERVDIQKMAKNIDISESIVYFHFRAGLKNEVDKKGKYYYVRFKANAEEMIEYVKKSWQKYGYVSVPILVKLGYGTANDMKNIGKALRFALPLALGNIKYEKSRVSSSTLDTNYLLYHPIGKKPEKIIE